MKNKDEYYLSKRESKRLYRRAYRSQIDNLEICGAVVIDPNNNINLHYLKNKKPTPGRFEIDINDLKILRRESKEKGERLAGTFHSHPISEAVPSPRDLKEARINSLMMIYDVCGCETRLWRVVKRGSKKEAKEIKIKKI